MQPEQRDAGYLWDMLDHARTIGVLAGETTFQQYLNDRKLQLAVERCMEIIGEAARQVSKAFKDAHPEIPWRRIIAQRNILAHEYRDIRQQRLWMVVTQRVPELVALLEPWIPPAPPETEGG